MPINQGETPLLRTPLTDYSSLFGVIDIQLKGPPLCKKFEMKYLNCLEAYGVEKGVEKCAAIREDLIECKYGEKQKARLEEIYREMEKQVKEGKLSYSKPPEQDTYHEVRL